MIGDTIANRVHLRRCKLRCWVEFLVLQRNVANSMSQWILKANGRIVPRRTVRPLLPAELAATNYVEKERRRKLDEAIKQRYGDALSLPDKPVFNFILYGDDETEPMQMPSDENPVDSEGRAVGEQSVFDRLIHAELTLPHGENHQYAKVLSRTRDEDGNLIGTYDDNPLLNTMLYDVEFTDGAVKQYSANIIAENIILPPFGVDL